MQKENGRNGSDTGGVEETREEGRIMEVGTREEGRRLEGGTREEGENTGGRN